MCACDTEGTCRGCLGGCRVITHAAMAAPASAMSSSTVAIINVVVDTRAARSTSRRLLVANHQGRTPPQDRGPNMHGRRCASPCSLHQALC